MYGWRGAVKTRRTGPSSATRPAYITSTRSQVSAMTDRSCVMRMSDRPSSRRSRSSSSRIWAWTMTSSAVVGSSPITIAGIAGERHRDHRPLAHAARQLVRIGADPLAAGCRPARAARPPASSRVARLAEPDLDRLGDLVADPADRVERVHRALEDDADLAPAVAPQLVARSSGTRSMPNSSIAARRGSVRSRAAAGPATARSSSCRSRTRRRCPSASPSRAGSSRRRPP